jgi:hypothetical protein
VLVEEVDAFGFEPFETFFGNLADTLWPAVQTRAEKRCAPSFPPTSSYWLRAVPAQRPALNVPYWTSDDIFELHKMPESITIVGGGYIACELGHFFGGIGRI